MSSEPLIDLDDVEVHFTNESMFGGDDGAVKAVDGVSLEIEDGDVVALVGESGCGKTTLGKAAIGLQRPTDGAVAYRGQDIWSAKDGIGDVDVSFRKIRRSLQIIHQDPGSSLNPNRTVLANLSVPLKKYRPDLGPKQREEIVHRFLERLGVTPPENYANRFPHQLSGGEQQRVVLSRALIMQPDLILADEAVSALDVSLRIEMMDLLLEMRDLFDTAFLFISHDFSNAAYLTKKTGGRIAVMYLGEIVEIGTPEEILENPKHPYTKTLVWSTPTLDPDEAAAELEAEPPVRTVDIPTPEDKPTGCSFNTRCPSIIPPEGMDIEQETYNEIMDLRTAVEEETLDLDRFRAASGRQGAASLDLDALVDSFFETTVPSSHRERIVAALDDLNGSQPDWDAAADALREDYESVCERSQPHLGEATHPAACHLVDEDRRVEQP